MTKKKNSILSDQRFVVLLVIIALSAVFSFMSKEFRQYTTILSMLDFSYYDLLMAIGVTFPLITGGVDLSIGTGTTGNHTGTKSSKEWRQIHNTNENTIQCTD